MAYCGYLSPHVGFIKALHDKGATAPEISFCLSVKGVDASASMINYILRSERAKVLPPEKVVTIIADWQAWTPEMQEAEFQMGYSR